MPENSPPPARSPRLRPIASSRRIPRPEPSGPVAFDWKSLGLRRTPQREIVLGLVQSSIDHPTAEWIHQEARQILPDISLATVYRTLQLLKCRGLVHEFSGGSLPSRFDSAGCGHEHVQCIQCGAVDDVDLPELGDLRERVAERTGYRVGDLPLLFHGLCDACARAREERRDAGSAAVGRRAGSP
jgi:Fe2+ or Zn2+ uptake regulation protein